MTVRDEQELRAVAFDVYGTIANINRRRAPFRKLLRYAEESGRTPQPDDAFNIMAFPGSIREVADHLGISLPASVTLALEADLITELESVTLFDDANDTLTALKERGLKIALCLNLAEPYAAPILRQLSLPFDCYAWSFAVGAIKPLPAIYAYVLERLDCLPSQVRFIGDTQEADVDGPRRMGMRAKLIDRRKGERLMNLIGSRSMYRLASSSMMSFSC